jgi:hypothetical protein
VIVAFFKRGAYDPMLDGGFASIDYDEDHKLIAGGGGGQATGPALRQNGSIFIRNLGTTPERELDAHEWDGSDGRVVRARERAAAGAQLLDRRAEDRGRVLPRRLASRERRRRGQPDRRDRQLAGRAGAAMRNERRLRRRRRVLDGDVRRRHLPPHAHGLQRRRSLHHRRLRPGDVRRDTLACDDGAPAPRTAASRAPGLHDLVADSPSVQAKIGTFPSLLERSPCDTQDAAAEARPEAREEAPPGAQQDRPGRRRAGHPAHHAAARPGGRCSSRARDALAKGENAGHGLAGVRRRTWPRSSTTCSSASQGVPRR